MYPVLSHIMNILLKDEKTLLYEVVFYSIELFKTAQVKFTLNSLIKHHINGVCCSYTVIKSI